VLNLVKYRDNFALPLQYITPNKVISAVIIAYRQKVFKERLEWGTLVHFPGNLGAWFKVTRSSLYYVQRL
jgi:hypothetical protein